jgi:hypothetical protein
MVLAWGLKRIASPGQEHFVSRTEALFRAFDEEKALVMIPAPALAEAMIGLPESEQTFFAEEIQKRFFVAPFEAKAAIWAKNKATNGQVRKDLGITKAHMKFDFQIIAIAKANDATCIYSHDAQDMIVFAAGIVEIRDIPVGEPIQQTLALPVEDKPMGMPAGQLVPSISPIAPQEEPATVVRSQENAIVESPVKAPAGEILDGHTEKTF